MDLKKLTWDKYESLFYAPAGEVTNSKTCELLGYKGGIPVLTNKTVLEANKPPTNSSINKVSAKQILRVETDSKTGEKFINLNGKKLRMVAEPQLSSQFKQNPQVIKASTCGDKKPVKVKIIGSMPSILHGPSRLVKKGTCQVTDIASSKPSVNKTDNTTQITQPVINVPVKIPSTDKVISGNSTAVCSNTVNSDHQAAVTPTQENGRCLKYKHSLIIYSDGLLKSPNGVLKMNPLDLSKVNKPDCVKVDVKKVDSSVQATVKTVDESVQTEDEDDLFNILNLDFLEYLSSNAPTTMTPKAAPVVVSRPEPAKAHSEKFQMFFQDLRRAMIPDMDGNRPIHVGVLTNDVSFVKRSCSILKALQTSVDVLNHGDLTALQLAVLNDSNPLIVKMLLAHGASLEVVDSEGNNIIHLAIEWKRTEMLDILLRSADERKFNLDDFNAEGLTPLMMCCCNNLVQCADLLLKYDADVNVKDRKSGRTALFHAAESHNFEMVQLLLNYNANTKIKNFFGTSPHDAMYEVDEIPENIKSAILGKTSKRKSAEEPKTFKIRKIDDGTNKLKTYARFKKIGDYEIPCFAAKAK
ncbi:uncharacterized protein LOC108909987 [Anoplophora glabripennis]|uniref:uncharacterized protein LOC108909987 n=1 Tax=Anoplophora glabripennis TaxID=217634 RepID=UPI0008749E59|nr:uncharacterized protein LOC108909987 [Anoplophora glabripennis]